MNRYFGAAKLLLFGEHCAVYGYPAAGIPLASGMTLKVGKRGRRISLSRELRRYGKLLEDFLAHIAASQTWASAFLDRHFFFSTNVPPGSGLGSSAALCTAFARYLLSCSSGVPSGLGPWQLANELEQFFHGTASGIDTGLACSEIPQAFYFGGAGLPEKQDLPFPDFPVVYGTVPRTADTKELVAFVKRQKSERPGPTGDILSGLGECSKQFITLLHLTDHTASEKAVRCGELCSTAQSLLVRLGLSTPELDAVIAAGNEAGACGGKLSGAGGGGAFWFAVDNLRTARKVKKAVARLSGRVVQIIHHSQISQ
ncbi:MAG: hypothetical protein JW874_12435 [Spirochaetales bacterium]|nr:hypothetical protein [Spirochaetales bacterium]